MSFLLLQFPAVKLLVCLTTKKKPKVLKISVHLKGGQQFDLYLLQHVEFIDVLVEKIAEMTHREGMIPIMVGRISVSTSD